MSFVRAGDITVRYRIEGPADAPVILFSNSIGTDLSIWDGVVDALAGRFRCLRYDTRGHGLTDAPDGPYSMAQLAGDCTALLDALGVEKAHVCGLSIGGMIAQQFAADHAERLDRLVLCDTGMRIGTPEMWQERVDGVRRKGLAGMADGVLQRWFTERFMQERPAETAGYRNMLTRTPAGGYAGACAAIRDADLTDAAGGIRAPTLVVCGSEDIATPPEMAAELAGRVPGAHSVSIDGAAHLPCVEQPAAVARELAAFLEA